MSLESVRAFFAEKAPDISVIESQMSSATVTLAAEAYGVEPARIAKTLSLRVGERVVLIVTAGTSRMDNKKVKALLGGKRNGSGTHPGFDHGDIGRLFREEGANGLKTHLFRTLGEILGKTLRQTPVREFRRGYGRDGRAQRQARPSGCAGS